jgi:DNA modification methylase
MPKDNPSHDRAAAPIRRVERILPLGRIRSNPSNARTHSQRQINQIAASIKACGFCAPVLVDEDLNLIAGHGRLRAAEQLGLNDIPAIVISGLSPARKRALALADNKISDNAGWDRERLAIELPELAELLIEDGLDISLTGFGAPEIDQLLVDFEDDSSDPGDEIEPTWTTGTQVSARGTLWILDQHRAMCGDARSVNDLDRLMGANKAAMGFLDVPYNVKVRSIVGRGRTRHAEFAMASGEMSSSAYVAFLVAGLGCASRMSQDGAVHFVCCDWRHVSEVIEAGRRIYGATLNIVVWVKTNGGQGSFYRSRHEFIVVFRVGDAAHLNNIELGRHGRSRSNVWNYPGVNTFRAGRMEDLRSHPTAKPVALVADAMRDCTRRGDIVLDTFSGSGTTIMAAERVGRRAYVMDIEPHYTDVAIRRWQAFTRKDAVEADTGRTFDQVAAERAGVGAGPKGRPARPGDRAVAKKVRGGTANVRKGPAPMAPSAAARPRRRSPARPA